MTALQEYDRLESPGLWRATPGDQRVEVIVSIGDATLTVSDRAERALSHWSLAALHRQNPGKRPALYLPSEDPEETEELEIDDDDMIDAIERVRKAIDRRRPRQGRVRVFLTGGIAGALVLLAVVWLPGALTRQTVSVLPDATRAAVGQKLLTRIRRVAGTPCTTRAGQAALDKLGQRVLGGNARLVVLSAGVTEAAHLPGRIILLNRSLVEDYEEPDVAAGFILAESLRARSQDPMDELLRHAGLIATIRMLTTGDLPDRVLDSYAEALMIAPPVPLTDAQLLAGFASAELRSSPYAYARDKSGETTLALIEADPVPVDAAEPLLPDGAWVSLQGICGE